MRGPRVVEEQHGFYKARRLTGLEVCYEHYPKAYELRDAQANLIT